jgi:hypothetical protein
VKAATAARLSLEIMAKAPWVSGTEDNSRVAAG